MTIFQRLLNIIEVLLGIKPIEFRKIKFFPRHRIVTYSLTTARDGTQIIWERGFSIKVIELDGDCQIYVGEKKEKAVDLAPQLEIEGFFKGFWLEHDAQSGKTLKLAIGIDPPFRVRYYERYIKEPDVLRGEDNTVVDVQSASYELAKTITLLNTSKNKPLKDVAYAFKTTDVNEQVSIKITVESDTVAETDEDEQSTTSTDYVYKRPTLSAEYYGLWVKLRVYMKGPVGQTGYARNEEAQGYGYTRSEIEYL